MTFFKKFRFFRWTVKAFWEKHKRLLLISILIGIGGFFIVSRISPYVPDLKKHERIAKVGFYEPQNLPLEIESLLSLGLTTISEDGQAAPGLAKSWEISEDGKTYTFQLADDIFWQDGTAVKANEIEYNFSNVEKEVVDEKTIKFRLKEPFAPFLITLSKPVFKKGQIGIGPYQIKRIQKKGKIIERIILTGPENDITYRFYPNDSASLLGFKLGEVDVIEQYLSFKLSDQWQKYVEVEEHIAKNQYLGIFLNTEDSMLTDKSVRQALAYAIKDRPSDETRAYGPISPDSWVYNSQIKHYDFDAEKARELLGEKNDEAESKKITISTTEQFLEIAEEIKQSWAEALNLEVEIQLINVLPADYQALLGIQEIPSDPDQYIFWHSTRAENITNFKNPRIDKLLEDGRKSNDPEIRKEKYFDFQKSLTEESPVIFLSHPLIYKIKRKSLLNFF